MNKKKRLGLCFQLFLTMFKIGAFTFGGGYAMISLLENEFITKKKWLDKDEFLNMVDISESTPGPVAINSATYIGYKISGLSGSICATLGVCIPSFIIIFIISLFFNRFLELKYVSYAFKGIQVCVVYLILSAGLKFMKSIDKKPFNYAVIISVLVCMLSFSVFAVNFSSIFYILICGIIGIMTYIIKSIKEKEVSKK